MTIKELINQFTNQNEKISKYLEVIQENLNHVDRFLPTFKSILEEEKYNAILGSQFARVLQLINENSFLDEYTLNDIEELYESLLGLYSIDLELILDFAYFEWSVLNNSEKAKKIIQTGIKVGTEKIAELKKLLSEIDENN